VHVNEQAVLLGPEPEERGPEDRAGFQIERPGGLFPGQPSGLAPQLRLREDREVHEWQGVAPRRIDHLDGHARPVEEPRAERLVAADDLFESEGEHRRSERPAETY
jgi:hypothetical protein